MKKFIKKIVLFALIISVICSGIAAFNIFIIGSQYGNYYNAALIDKVERLEAINEPKIILIGDSNVAFGIDSKKIEDAMGMPVVNCGLDATLGNAFHEEIAKLNINEGDIVVVCHSSFSDTDRIINRSRAWHTIDNNGEIVKILRWKDYLPMLAAYPDYLKSTVLFWLRHDKENVDLPGTYARSSFNVYGDVIVKTEEEQMDAETFFSNPENQIKIKVPEINDICVTRLNEYNKYITKRGASMVIAGYPIAYGKYASFTQKEFIDFKNELQDVLDCPVISDYTDYFFSYDYFYDTHLHLNKEGAEMRTEQLISDLKKWLLQR